MPNIVLTDVVKRWKDFYATDHVSLEIPDKAFVTLLGPSGCGKTTILRMIAGLETPTSGQIKIGDHVVFDSEAGINVPANKRKVGFLFQNYALWPNMTVYQNIAFGLKNVKEELPTYDYDYKTRTDVIRILENPKKVITLVNDARDKKGKIIDDRAIIKIIDEFTVSIYTAKEIFKLHLEEGNVEEKVAAKVEEAKAAIAAVVEKWALKDILIEEDGKLVKVPNYNILFHSGQPFDEELKTAYAREKEYDTVIASLDGILRRTTLSAKSDEIVGFTEEIDKHMKVSETSHIRTIVPQLVESKKAIFDIIEKVIEKLPVLGQDYQKLIVAVLKRYVLEYSVGDYKAAKKTIKELNLEISQFNKQISNQLSTFIDKLPKNLASAKFDEALSEILKELDYLPEDVVSEIKNELDDLGMEPTLIDRKTLKDAQNRLEEGLSAVKKEDRDMVKNHIGEIENVVRERTIKEFYAQLEEELKGYEPEVILGIKEEFKNIIVCYLGTAPSSLKKHVSNIENIAKYLCDVAHEAVDPVYELLNEPAVAYGNCVKAIQNDDSIVRSQAERIEGHSTHLKSTRGLDKEEIELSLRRVARIVKVEEFMDRYPNELSGGQQQRVAIARTLAPGPKVLFMDEPLSNLDAKLRLEMRSELKRLHVETGATFVYVTHDQLEAMTLATHICLLNNGVLQQYDAPLTIYNKPDNLFVADFVGNPAITLVEVKATQQEDGSIHLGFFKNREAIFTPNTAINLEQLRKERDEKALKKAELLSVLKKQRSYVEKGNKDVTFNYHIVTTEGTLDRKDEKDPEIDDYVIGIRPEYFTTRENGSGLPGEVYSAMPSGMETTIKINVDGFILTSVIFGAMDYRIGEKIEIDTKGNNILLFDKVSGELIASGTLTLK